MNIQELDLWQAMLFFFTWYLSIAFFVLLWRDNIILFLLKSLFAIKLSSILSITMIKWFIYCGTKYYVVYFRFHNDEENKWRVIEFPPIR